MRRNLDKLTVGEIGRVAKKYFDNSRSTTVILKKTDEQPIDTKKMKVPSASKEQE